MHRHLICFAPSGNDLRAIHDNLPNLRKVHFAFWFARQLGGLRPVARYFDRITRPEQLLDALPRAFAIMNDGAECGSVNLAFCQDVQVEKFFEPKIWYQRRQRPGESELNIATLAIRDAANPLIIAGGSIHYSGACEELARFAAHHNIAVCEPQAGTR